jgi:hypothetical protein
LCLSIKLTIIEASIRQRKSAANAILKAVPTNPIEEMANSRHRVESPTSTRTIALVKKL